MRSWLPVPFGITAPGSSVHPFCPEAGSLCRWKVYPLSAQISAGVTVKSGKHIQTASPGVGTSRAAEDGKMKEG